VQFLTAFLTLDYLGIQPIRFVGRHTFDQVVPPTALLILYPFALKLTGWRHV